jgi:Arc/MetJ-type ribon-helix-helix transcriptional regulator
MTAKSLHVTLPERLHNFVESRVAQVGYSTKSDYVQQLIRADMRFVEQERLKNMLLESLASGRKDYTEKEWLSFREQISKSVSA